MFRADGLAAGVCVCATALAASLGLTRPAAGEWPVPQTAVEMTVVWVDLCETPAGLREATARHIQDVLRPAAIRVSSRNVVAGWGGPIEGVMVVLMGSTQPRGPGHSAGGAAGRRAATQPTVWVFPRAVAGGLGLDLARSTRWTALERYEFGRALAMVVLHELAHTLVGVGHRRQGFLSDGLRRSDLVDPHLTVDPDLLSAFREAVADPEAAAREAPTGGGMPLRAALWWR